MNTNAADKLLYYRLVALWVLCEAMLGGIIHGFKLVGSGLLVGSCAVICISLIAFYFPRKGVILKATIIVAIFKMLLSPQSPPTAYIAVFFQGAMGELLFSNRKYFKAACYVLAPLALVESAVQRFLVLTILYGTAAWKAVDMFITKLTGEKEITSYSLYFAAGYVLMHLFVGIWVGSIAAKLPQQIKKLPLVHTSEALPINATPKKKKWKRWIIVVWVLLLVLLLQSELKIGKPLLPSHLSLRMFVRSLLIVAAWYFIISPFVLKLMKQWLQKKQSKLQPEIDAIFKALPSIKAIAQQSWLQSADKKGISRLLGSMKLTVANTVNSKV